jgi:hypothetical protein
MRRLALLLTFATLATTASSAIGTSYSNAGQIIERLDKHSFAEMTEPPLLTALEAKITIQLTIDSLHQYVLDVYVFGGERLARALARSRKPQRALACKRTSTAT